MRRTALLLPLLLLLVGLCPADPAAAYSTQFLGGPAQGGSADGAGHAVAGRGDFNGDGIMDYAYGRPYSDPNGASSGSVVVAVSQRQGAQVLRSFLTIAGRAAGDSLGLAVCFVDLDGDRFDDLVVGAPGADVGSLQSAGRVFVYVGGATPDSTPDAVFNGTTAGEMAGYSLANAGALNALPGSLGQDLVIGAPRRDNGAAADVGAVYVVTDEYVSPATGTLPTLTADFTSLGTAAGEQLGYAVAGAGDLNSDGYDDIAVGRPFSDSPAADAGSVSVLLGGRAPTGAVDLTFTGLATNDAFGSSLAMLDMNGDGVADLATGAPGANSSTGSVTIALGSASFDGVADLTLPGVAASDLFGGALASAGDVNGDGIEDLLVGARNGGVSSQGAAYAYFGSTTLNSSVDLTFGGEDANDSYGWAVAGIGDADGDGYGDVVVGDPDFDGVTGSNCGGVWAIGVFSYRVQSPNGGEILYAGSTRTVSWLGHDPADLQFSADGGASWVTLAAAVGGLESNTCELTVPDEPTEHGRLRLVFRGQTATAATSDATDGEFRVVRRPPSRPVASRKQFEIAGAAGQRLGAAVSASGDWNGDGYDDLAVGLPLAAGGQGQVQVYFGGPDPDAVVDVTLAGEPASTGQFGAALAFVGDMNRDGVDDLVVGAPTFGATETGRAYLFLGGAVPDATSDAVLSGSAQANAHFGTAVARLGDLDRNFRDDFGVGEPGYTNYHAEQGRVVVFTAPTVGVAPSALRSLDDSYTGEHQGTAIAGGVDVTGDGQLDIVVGSPGPDVYGSRGGGICVYAGGARMDEYDDIRWGHSAATDSLGTHLAAGDFDGDGIGDVVATIGSGSSRRLALFTGGPSVPFLAPATRTWFMGYIDNISTAIPLGVAAADVNGDGVSDVLVGLATQFSSSALAVFWGRDVLSANPDLTLLQVGTTADSMGLAVTTGDLDGDGFPDVAMGGARAAGPGRVIVHRFGRYLLTSPNGGETWNVGASRQVSWRGAEPADVQLSVDGGASWQTLATGVGGAVDNTHVLRVPHLPTRFARLRVVPSDPAVHGTDASDSLFTIQSSVTLLALQAQPAAEGGVRLEWSTDVAVGPEGLAGYRVYRVLGEADAGVRVSADLLVEGRFLDPTGTASHRWRVTAVNGLGEELELGRTGVAGATAGVRAFPSPLRAGDALTVRFGVPLGAAGLPASDLDVGLYDVTGRRVLALANGQYTPGMREVRVESSRLRAGLYFVRAVAPSVGHDVHQRVVVVK